MQGSTVDLDSVFAALANPTRRDMLARLSRERLSVGELAAAYSMSGPAVTQHLNVLERAGLIRRETRRQWRDCVVTPEGLEAAAEWIDAQRAEWNERFDLLAERLSNKRNQEKR
jgi:DNA-binding transcriptional ArsR family regulator